MDEWRLLRQNLQAQDEQRAALERYNAAQASLQQVQARPSGPLENILSGIANSFKNVGDTLYDMGGTGIASIRDLVTGNAGSQKYQNEWKQYRKEQMGDENMSDKDYYAKTGGKALDAAATVSDFIPGIGTAARAGLNVGQGVVSGVAQNYIDNGANVSLEDALKGGLIGGASAGVGQAVGGKLAARANNGGLINKALTNNISRGAITGATAGATGGALSAGLNGGDVLSGALQGAQGGALGGAAMAGISGVAGAGVDKVRNKLGLVEQPQTVAPVTPEVDTDSQTVKKGNMLGRALKNMGNELETAQTDITRAERRKFGINNAGETVDNLRKRTGFSSLQDQADFAKNITGGPDSVMDTIQKYRLSRDAKGNPITLRQDQYEVAINDAVGKDWKKSVMGESYDKFRDDLISDIVNEDPISAANWLKQEAATQRGIADAKGPTSDVAGRKAKIYTEVANKIDELTYSAVPKENVNKMFDDTIDEFYTRAQEARTSGNKKYANAYEKLAKELEGTERTIANYRTFKKDFVKSSQLADISAGARSGSLQAGLSRGRNIIDKTLNTLAEEPINRAMAYAGGKINDLGDAINGASTGAVGRVAGAVGGATGAIGGALNNNTLNGVAMRQVSRQAGLGTDRALQTQNQLQQSMQDAQNAQTDFENAGALRQQIVNASPQAQIAAAQQVSPAQSQLDTISRGMERALAAGDLKAYGQLADLYQQAYKIYGADLNAKSGTSSLNATQQGNLAKLESAGSAIDQLEQLYNQAGGGQGRLGGKIAELGANLGMNSAASSYNSAARGLINQIAAAVGKTDSLNTEGEVQRALDLVPKITDTPEEAQTKLQSLRNMLEANKQTYTNIYGVGQ